MSPLSLISLRVLGQNQHDGGLESVLTTYSNNFPHRECSFSSHGLSSSSSSEHNRSNRAITESSLSFTTGDFCSSVSEHRNEIIELGYFVKSEEGIEGRLGERTDHQRKG